MRTNFLASLLLLNSFALATRQPNEPVLQAPKQSTLVERVESMTHSIAHDLRVAFGGILLSPSARKAHRHRSSQLRKRASQEVLSSEYCAIALKGTNGTVDGDKGSSVGTSPASYNPSASATLNSGAPAPSATATSPASNWYLAEAHQGTNFFDGWDFFEGSDPTHGTVTYVPADTAFEAGLASVTDSVIYMRVETSSTVSNTRQSVRITTKNQYSNGALFILDVVHMPSGCAVWPAWWTNGPTWPQTGEIDIIEGVGDYTNNQATIHTDPGCKLSSGDSKVLNITGSIVGGTDCSALDTGNQGCGVRAAEGNSFGAALNAVGGGVYAMVWTAEGISIHFFPRDSIPNDIKSNAPAPESWPQPQARWPASGCDPFKYFQKHSAIFDTTLCGDWAAGVWGSSGIPGQEESCAARTGFSSCEEFVRQRGDAFKEAYWEINWMRIYKQKS